MNLVGPLQLFRLNFCQLFYFYNFFITFYLLLINLLPNNLISTRIWADILLNSKQWKYILNVSSKSDVLNVRNLKKGIFENKCSPIWAFFIIFNQADFEFNKWYWNYHNLYILKEYDFQIATDNVDFPWISKSNYALLIIHNNLCITNMLI